MKKMLSLLLLFLAAPIAAQTALPPAPYADKQLQDPAKEAQARELMHELRCLQCQSQSIADSNAPMAGDMRNQVRTRIAEGWSPERIRNWLIERYGNWVTYDPPVEPLTWPLWVAPILLVLIGLLLARGRFRRRGEKN